MSGLRLAALFGFRPHTLGLCGPDEARRQKLLKRFLAGKLSHNQILPVMKKFKGAMAYYRLIAQKNKIATGPFNKKVVEAYWIGNELLEKVTADDLRKMIMKNFSGPELLPKKVAQQISDKIPFVSKPHHSFHVLAIGSVTGTVNFKNTKLKDLCRVGWGKALKKTKIQNSKLKVLVRYQPLVGKRKIKLGKPIKKEIIWDKEILPDIKIGDWVSFHWGQAVKVLLKKEVANLKKYTLNTLNSLNRR